MSLIDKVLRIGEGKILRQLDAIAKAVNAIEDDFVAMTDDELRGMTLEFKERLEKGESLDDIMPEAFATVREAAKRVLGQRHFDVQIMGGAALHLGNIAEMKTGEGKTLVSTLPAYLNALSGQGRPRRHGQRLPGQVPRRVDGPDPPVPRPHRRRDPAGDASRRASRRLQRRHHLRDQQRARLRLPARQHGHRPGVLRAAPPVLRHRRRGRLDPDRRGPHAADHLRPHAGRGRVVRRVREGRRPADEGHRLRGRREEAHHLDPRARHHQGRGPPRHREPLRVREHPADLVPEQLDQGQGAVPQRQGVRRHGGRGPHRRRAHRPHPVRPPLQRRPAPGHRGQGGRDRPRGVPDARHDHPAELLPPLREALRHDRYGHDRGLRVRQDLQARRGPDPDQQADGPRRPGRPHLPHRGGEVRRRRRRHRRAVTRRVSRSWSAPPRWRSPSCSPAC